MNWMADIAQDARFAVRLLTKERWFSVASVVTLALGIGVTNMVVTIINGYNFRGLPVPDPDRIVHVGTRDFAGRDRGLSYPDYQDWRAGSRSLAAWGAFSNSLMTVSEPGHAPESVGGAYVSAEAFRILEAAPVLGRGFAASDDRAGAPPVVVLGHRLWTSRYNADPGVLGRSLIVNRMATTVIGVMPEGFEFPFREALWLPLAVLPGLEAQARDDRTLSVFGQLADGATAERARAELAAMAAGLASQHPQTNRVQPIVERFGVQQVGRFGSEEPPLALLATALFVLLIACANVANLLLARSAGRARELAVRASVGATRGRIVRQLLVESLVLSVIASALGLWLSRFGVQFVAEAFGRNVPYWMSFPVDGQVVGVLTVVCGAVTVLFGLAPALVVSRPSAHNLVSDTGRGGPAPRIRRWTQALMIGELALTVVLLAGSGLLVRSFLALYRGDQVIDASQILTMQLTLPEQAFPTPERRVAFYGQLDGRLASIPGVPVATLASSRPFVGSLRRQLTLADRPGGAAELPGVPVVAIGPRYFDTLRLGAVRGRYFSALDGTPGHQNAVVNQQFADTYYPDADPIGRLIKLTEPKANPASAPWLTIVGVSPSIRQGIAAGVRPLVYVPLAQHAGPEAAVIVGDLANAPGVAARLRQEVAALDPDVTLFNVRPLSALRDDSRLQPRLVGSVLAGFAIIALLLSMVGLYAVTAYAVQQRRHEIGVRMALGAPARLVIWLFVKRGLGLLAIGLPLGLAGAFAVGMLLQGILVQTSPTDPATLASIVVLVLAVSVAACLFPARRAVQVDPLAALRSE